MIKNFADLKRAIQAKTPFLIVYFPAEAVRAGMSAGDRHGARPDGSAYRSGVAPCRDGLPER